MGKDRHSIEINSLSDFINAINDLTKDFRLYNEIIYQFIEKIKNKKRSTQKDWKYYSSSFIIQEVKAISYAFAKLLYNTDSINKAELFDLQETLLEVINTYFQDDEIIPDQFAITSEKAIIKSLEYSPEKTTRPLQVYYRGEASVDWVALPSVLRDRESYVKESFYYHEIQVRCPKDFENQSFLNRLVTMQHYELPTRLLDITSNPLNALYFACECKKKKNKDGRVTFFPTLPGSMSYGDSDKALILSCLPHLTMYEQFQLIDEIKKSSSGIYREEPSTSILNKLLLEIRAEKPAFQPRIALGDILNPLFVQPNMTNPRIINQQGAFLLSGLSKSVQEAKEKIKSRMAKTHLIIPASQKDTILEELDAIGINQATIYPNLDKIAGYLKNQ
ncbi:FRG domain-containing protein [uncultured Fibrobacter sp.]|uniref:FRG domain-containing protein n=1 Tax=uncultured Fibrobacter sp. TaxID=261512 RepID=UPI0025EDA1F0|nr:FRG domain-containing protein [uncultured Fibrobacter sp.]